MQVFSGQSASIGFALGPAVVLKKVKPVLSQKASAGATLEVEFFRSALQKAERDLEELKQKALKQNKSESVEILEAHLMLLADPEVAETTQAKIQTGTSAEMAYDSVIEDFRQAFLNLEDDYMKQRALDLQDIRERVLFYIQNPKNNFPDLVLDRASVVIAHDLTPSQILSIDRSSLLGFVTVDGGSTSHTAILARSLEVPAIVGATSEVLNLESGVEICLNAEKGQITVQAGAIERQTFLETKKKYELKMQELTVFKGQPSKTADGVEITLAANISGPQDLDSFWRNDAQSVGLYRTEFLFLDRASAPSEDEQYKVYKEVFRGLKGRPMLVRTLDIGGDKTADYLGMKEEENPFLGVRALRLCFQRPEIFKTQLRALLRAGAGAEWGLMFPMVSQLEELLQAKEILTKVQGELQAEGQEYSRKFQVGIMVEIPSVAWMMDIFAKHVDFVSLGTNDLVQYTCAADRLNPELKSVYNPFNPGFLRQVHHVLKTCRDLHVHSGICGSLSHHPLLMPFFIGCGVHELSMTSQHILSTRATLSRLNYKNCEKLVSEVLSCAKTSEVQEKLQQFVR